MTRRALRYVVWIVAIYVGALVLQVLKPLFRQNAQRLITPSTGTSQPVLPQQHQAIYDTERRNWLGNVTMEEFYSSPDGWERHSAGKPIRLQAIDTVNFTNVPHGLPLYRLLYVSLDHDDKSVPASAFVLFPYAQPGEQNPFPTIVWAHGTAGLERQCAPSNQRNLYYDSAGPVAMALRGYAVIAPDYAGLGSDTTFQYVSALGHAADISYAVVAARIAFPNGRLSQEWIAVGHSEGGTAVWAVNEREMVKPTGGFRGAVAIAPALQPLGIIRYGVSHGGLGDSMFYASYTLSAIARFNHSVNATRCYSALGMDLTRLAATACIYTAQALFANYVFSDIFKDPSWLESAWAMSWQNRMTVKGNMPLAVPLLIVQGLADTAVYPDLTKEIFKEHCISQPKSRAQLNLYPNMDHDAVVLVSQLEVFKWIEDRFNGKSVLPGCSTHVVRVA